MSCSLNDGVYSVVSAGTAAVDLTISNSRPHGPASYLPLQGGLSIEHSSSFQCHASFCANSCALVALAMACPKAVSSLSFLIFRVIAVRIWKLLGLAGVVAYVSGNIVGGT